MGTGDRCSLPGCAHARAHRLIVPDCEQNRHEAILKCAATVFSSGQVPVQSWIVLHGTGNRIRKPRVVPMHVHSHFVAERKQNRHEVILKCAAIVTRHGRVSLQSWIVLHGTGDRIRKPRVVPMHVRIDFVADCKQIRHEAVLKCAATVSSSGQVTLQFWIVLHGDRQQNLNS